MRITSTSGFVVMAVVIIGGVITEYDTYAEPKDEVVTTVRAQDIPRKVQIIGRCGQPLRSLLTVRGQWIRPAGGIGQVKDDSLRFRIELVNGKDLETKTEIHEFEVLPISPDHKGGRVRKKDSEVWDWRFDWDADDPPPSFGEGERYEILGVETGGFRGYPEAIWREIRGVPAQSPAVSGPFATRLEFIAVRRLREISPEKRQRGGEN